MYGLPPTEITLAAMLKGAGYHTAMIGKWHLGTTPNYSPTYHGFDEWFGLPWSDDMGCKDKVWPNLPLRPACAKDNQTTSEGKLLQKNGTQQWPLPLYHSTAPNCSGHADSCNSDIIEMPADLSTLASRYAEQADAVFAKAAQPGSPPFLLYVGFAHMHAPQFCADSYVGKTGAGHFADALLEFDDTVGAMVAALDKHSLAEDTLVLVTGDNGPWEVKCGAMARYSNPGQQLLLLPPSDACPVFAAWTTRSHFPAFP